MHYVYIIESESSGIWYYGYSIDLRARLDGHNKGLNVSTRGRGPWRYIFQRPFDSKKEALQFERYLKQTRNKQYVLEKYREWFISP